MERYEASHAGKRASSGRPTKLARTRSSPPMGTYEPSHARQRASYGVMRPVAWVHSTRRMGSCEGSHGRIRRVVRGHATGSMRAYEASYGVIRRIPCVHTRRHTGSCDGSHGRIRRVVRGHARGRMGAFDASHDPMRPFLGRDGRPLTQGWRPSHAGMGSPACGWEPSCARMRGLLLGDASFVRAGGRRRTQGWMPSSARTGRTLVPHGSHRLPAREASSTTREPMHRARGRRLRARYARPR